MATIANATSLLWLANWDGFGISAEVRTAIVLAVAVMIAGAMALTRADAAYLLVLVWAFVGIAVKHPGVPVVATSVWIAMGMVAIMAIVSLIPRSTTHSICPVITSSACTYKKGRLLPDFEVVCQVLFATPVIPRKAGSHSGGRASPIILLVSH